MNSNNRYTRPHLVELIQSIQQESTKKKSPIALVTAVSSHRKLAYCTSSRPFRRAILRTAPGPRLCPNVASLNSTARSLVTTYEFQYTTYIALGLVLREEEEEATAAAAAAAEHFNHWRYSRQISSPTATSGSTSSRVFPCKCFLFD